MSERVFIDKSYPNLFQERLRKQLADNQLPCRVVVDVLRMPFDVPQDHHLRVGDLLLGVELGFAVADSAKFPWASWLKREVSSLAK